MKQRPDRGFLIPISIVNAAGRRGLELEELQRRLRLSTRYTHEIYNRRHDDLLLQVEGGKLISFHLEENTENLKVESLPDPVRQKPPRCSFCNDQKKIPVFDTCYRCDGEGYKSCDEGLVPNSIPCPACTKQKTMFATKIRF